ncbi:MAG: hypothetical protein DMF80_14780 [Acidobacteria bacterium]|nr:MAG: hypothetical protein DMF80_14780 [Acidobacteriota bacterium]
MGVRRSPPAPCPRTTAVAPAPWTDAVTETSPTGIRISCTLLSIPRPGGASRRGTNGCRLAPRMLKVLIVGGPELTSVLERTVVWRSDVDRVFAADLEAAFAAACDALPKLVILDGAPQEQALDALRRFRNDGLTRRMSLAVLRRSATVPEVEALRRAGANIVFAGEALPYLWDAWLEELLEVPRRRVVRVPVRLDVWSRFDASEEPLRGSIVDISVKGMLLETDDPVEVGTKLDLSFRLPGDPTDLRVVAQVIRQEPGEEGRARAGVEFVIVREAVRERIRAFVEHEPER